jgi:hypothetical protein
MSNPPSPQRCLELDPEGLYQAVVYAGAWTNETYQQADDSGEEDVILESHPSSSDASAQDAEGVKAGNQAGEENQDEE